MATQNTTQQIKAGDYFYESWGYDQTNIDYLRVESVSPSGKSAMCKMARQIVIEAHLTSDSISPGETYGAPFRMMVRFAEWREDRDLYLKGSYPFVENYGSRRMGSFHSCAKETTHYQTNSQSGH